MIEAHALWDELCLQVAHPRHEKIEAEFDKAKDRIKRVDLYLNSCGGSIREMKATIASLRHIKETHRLETGVGFVQAERAANGFP